MVKVLEQTAQMPRELSESLQIAPLPSLELLSMGPTAHRRVGQKDLEGPPPVIGCYLTVQRVRFQTMQMNLD